MYKCVGCGRHIPWGGTGLFSYACPCGAAIFYNEETGAIALPASIAIRVSKGQALPHLGDLVGESDYTSSTKERLIAELRERGFIWMEECEQCQKDGTLKRKQDQEKYRAVQEADRISMLGDGD